MGGQSRSRTFLGIDAFDSCPRTLRIDYFHSLAISKLTFFIGPESDHCLPLSLTNSLTDSCLVNLIDVTLACEDANSKLVEVVTVANVDSEDHVGNSLLQIWDV